MDLALVGIGKIAIDQHVPALAASADWTLAATVSRHGSVPGVPSYTDLGEMLADRPDIRVVSLCMPPVPRFAYAIEALRAGRHVMLEKPPGATLSECQTLLELARERRVTLYASWHSREAAKVAEARAWLAGRRLTRLRIIWKEGWMDGWMEGWMDGWKEGWMEIASLPSFQPSKRQTGSKLVTIIRPKSEMLPLPQPLFRRFRGR